MLLQFGPTQLSLRTGAAALLAIALCLVGPAAGAAGEAASHPASAAPSSPTGAVADPVLMENSTTQIRRSDFEAQLLQLPPGVRGGFTNSKERIKELLPRMLVTKTLAVEAERLGIDKEPDVVARLRNETERFLARLRLARVESAAAKEFDAKGDANLPRARELYAANPKKWEQPAEVKASHILFSTERHTREEALNLAKAARAKIMAGADFNAVAREESEDPSAKQNGGELGWFARGTMDPAFTDAAFNLTRDGDVSEPVHSRFGWHLIKREGSRPAKLRPFDEVKKEILGEMRNKYVAEKRDEFIMKLRNDPTMVMYDHDVDALVTKGPDEAALGAAIKANVKAMEAEKSPQAK